MRRDFGLVPDQSGLMKTNTKIDRLRSVLVSVFLTLSVGWLAPKGHAQAQGARKWTDVEGRVVEASLVSVSENSITIRLNSGQVATVEKTRLSQQDLEYLKQTSPVEPSLLGEEAEPAFFTAEVDPKIWEESDEIKNFGIANFDFDSQVETPHLIVTAGEKVRESYLLAYVETGERLFHQIRSDIPALAERLEGGKTCVWLAVDHDDHELFGQVLTSIANPSVDWNTSSIASVSINRDVCEKFGLHRNGRGFNVEFDRNDQGDIRWGKRIHFMTSTILGSSLPFYTNADGNASWEMFQLSYSYYLERIIAGRVKTKVKFSNEPDVVEGFKYGWEGVTKKLMSRAPLKPSIVKFSTLNSGDAEPIDMAFGYGLVRYIFSDPQRKLDFNKLMAACIEDRKTATADDYVKACGATSIEDLDANWAAYLMSEDF